MRETALIILPVMAEAIVTLVTIGMLIVLAGFACGAI